MSRIALDSTPFYGKVSRPVTRAPSIRTECLACGSSLAGRYQGLSEWDGKVVRVWRCGCGTRRMLEVKAA